MRAPLASVITRWPACRPAVACVGPLIITKFEACRADGKCSPAVKALLTPAVAETVRCRYPTATTHIRRESKMELVWPVKRDADARALVSELKGFTFTLHYQDALGQPGTMTDAFADPHQQ